jgi:glutamyl-tRNA synthetase
LLLGWSLDDSTEDFDRQAMLKHFTLARINKAPASFDPQKLVAFQSRWMHRLPIEEKVSASEAYLISAGLLPQSPSEGERKRLAQVLTAADDRIKIAGDILDYDDFFVPDEQLAFDSQAFEKRLKSDETARGLLLKFRDALAALDPFDAVRTEECLKRFVEAEGIKFNQIIHALRVSVTGKAVGFGMFETLAILGKKGALSRIDRALKLAS